jgi:hypothetical protein
MTLTWLDLSKVGNGTRVVFTAAHDIFPECIVPAGTTATVTENGLHELMGLNTGKFTSVRILRIKHLLP